MLNFVTKLTYCNERPLSLLNYKDVYTHMNIVNFTEIG